jgi:hypothetical protein
MNYAVAWLAPRRDFAVLVATNLGNGPAAEACDRAAWALIQRCLLQPWTAVDSGRRGAVCCGTGGELPPMRTPAEEEL